MFCIPQASGSAYDGRSGLDARVGLFHLHLQGVRGHAPVPWLLQFIPSSPNARWGLGFFDTRHIDIHIHYRASFMKARFPPTLLLLPYVYIDTIRLKLQYNSPRCRNDVGKKEREKEGVWTVCAL